MKRIFAVICLLTLLTVGISGCNRTELDNNRMPPTGTGIIDPTPTGTGMMRSPSVEDGIVGNSPSPDNNESGKEDALRDANRNAEDNANNIDRPVR